MTPREREILTKVCVGKTNAEIGRDLGLTERTVKSVLGRVFTKLGVRNRVEAVMRTLFDRVPSEEEIVRILKFH